MKILLYEWKCYGQEDIIKTLIENGQHVDRLKYSLNNYDEDIEFSNFFEQYIKGKQYDAVFSFNYFTVLSNLCMKFGLKYICWIYDAPLLHLYSYSIHNKCNYIFVFDKYLYQDLLNYGVKTIYHLPLAVNVKRLDNIKISEQEKRYFSSNVSFVGSLYNNRNFYDQIQYLPEYIKGYLEGIMASQKKIYGYYFLEELLNDTILNEIKKYVKFDLGKEYFAKESMVFATLFLSQKLTSIERKETLELLAKVVPVTLYSEDRIKKTGIIEQGCVDYVTEMPKVFRLSKINLNITLRCIRSGVPLRVMDILGAGGFCLTNYQPELEELFTIGEDLVVYDGEEDLENKVIYYLEHEQEREKIANQGYQKVKKYHSMQKRIEKILEIVNNEIGVKNE